MHPYSSKCLVELQIDYFLPLLDVLHLTLVEKEIHNNADTETFIEMLKSTVQVMLSKYAFIESTCSCQMLRDKTQLSFAPYVRPSKLVKEAYCIPDINTPEVQYKIEELGVV